MTTTTKMRIIYHNDQNNLIEKNELYQLYIYWPNARIPRWAYNYGI